MAQEKSLPNRKTAHIKDYDYASCGAYFVTICTAERKRLLSTICRDDPCGRPRTELTEIGKLAEHTLGIIEKQYNVEFICSVIMPDHIHFVLFIPPDRATARVAPTDRTTARVAPTLGNIVGAYKSLIAHQYRMICNERGDRMGRIWQRGYYEHIVRNRSDLSDIRQYIEENPARWYYKNNP